MVVDELVRFRDITEETLVWTRPNLLAFRYELVCSTGPLARLSIKGIGADRYVLAETADQCWRFGMFPLERREVPISREGQEGLTAKYVRGEKPEIAFEDGSRFSFGLLAPPKTVLADTEGRTVFTVEQVEEFPRWRADLKLEQDALMRDQLPVLLAAVCCQLVFD